MEAGTPIIDPPTHQHSVGVPDPTDSGFDNHPQAVDPPASKFDSLPVEKVKITLTRIRALRSKSNNLAKAYREFMAASSELLTGREDDSTDFAAALTGAKLDVQEGNLEEANVRIVLLAEEFESLHA